MIKYPEILKNYETSLDSELKFEWVSENQYEKCLSLDSFTKLNLKKTIEIAENEKNKKKFAMFLCNETKNNT